MRTIANHRLDLRKENVVKPLPSYRQLLRGESGGETRRSPHSTCSSDAQTPHWPTPRGLGHFVWKWFKRERTNQGFTAFQLQIWALLPEQNVCDRSQE
jgi:hypothetical protein